MNMVIKRYHDIMHHGITIFFFGQRIKTIKYHNDELLQLNFTKSFSPLKV